LVIYKQNFPYFTDTVIFSQALMSKEQ